jgi:hypothetical protein
MHLPKESHPERKVARGIKSELSSSTVIAASGLGLRGMAPRPSSGLIPVQDARSKAGKTIRKPFA